MNNLIKIKVTFPLTLLTLLINSCEKTDVPQLLTNLVTDITPESATSGGEIVSNGGATISSRGICFGTSQNPTVDNLTSVSNDITDAFTCQLKELTPNTLYYVRSFAKNSVGVGYGNEATFTTLPPDPVSVTDVDGNIYNVVRIKSQVWMKENLRTTRWPDGKEINLITSDFSWGSLSQTAEAYCWYNNDTTNKDIYGALYTWAAAQGACPTGWHVPSKDEWAILGSPANLNNLQFGGCRSATGEFTQIGLFGHWWTSTQIDAGNSYEAVLDLNFGYRGIPVTYKYYGISVRCIKDN
jgi:hypothetical protein